MCAWLLILVALQGNGSVRAGKKTWVFTLPSPGGITQLAPDTLLIQGWLRIRIVDPNASGSIDIACPNGLCQPQINIHFPQLPGNLPIEQLYPAATRILEVSDCWRRPELSPADVCSGGWAMAYDVPWAGFVPEYQKWRVVNGVFVYP